MSGAENPSPTPRDLLAEGDAVQALAAAEAALKRDPGDAEAAFVAAIVFAESGRLHDALAAMERIAGLVPANAEYLAHHGRMLIMARRNDDALVAARAAVAAGSEESAVLDTIGGVFARLGLHDEAVPLFERAVSMAPERLEFRFNLAGSLGVVGRMDEAAAQYEAIIAIAPAHGRAHLALAGLRRTPDAANVARIDAAIRAGADPAEAVRLHYAAATMLEQAGDHAGMFAHLASGNALHRARLGYDPASDDAIFDALRRTFARELPLQADSTLRDAPLFVVGLPRTGTALVARILAAHPQVTAAGELQAMPLAIKQLAGTSSRMVLDPATVTAMAGQSAQAVGERYLLRARQHAGALQGRFTDTFPLNFLYIGWIAQAFPEASIVCLRRGAMDSVWNNFKHLFAQGSPYYRWSYDLMDTARYVLAFQRLMAFWRQRFPGRIHEVTYEMLVNDQEVQTRRMLAHCGLEWDPACAVFPGGAAATDYADAPPLREPITPRAIGRWREYEAQLGPVMDFFAENGIPFD